MALNHNTDMLYTRPGAAESNVLSAHDPLIWEFEDTAIVGGPATATVQFIAKDNDLAVIYTSAAFPAYLLSYVVDLAKFRFDGTQILKHIINNYFYKEISTIIEPVEYGSTVDVVFRTYDDGGANANDTVTYYLSQAVNQIGDEYGSNIPRLFLNDTEDIAHFLGYPTKIFFYLAVSRAAHSPLIEIIDRSITESTNLITGWTNIGYNTFDTTDTAIDDAVELGVAALAESDEIGDVVVGDRFLIIIPALVNVGGELPTFYFRGTGSADPCSNILRAVVGDNAFVLTVHTARTEAQLYVANAAAADWNCDDIQVIPVEDASDYGSLKIAAHCVDLGLLALSMESKYARMYYDHDAPISIKDYNLHVFEGCENAVFVRWLDSDGYYSYWLFSAYPKTTKSGDKLGSVINNFTEMALANSCNLPGGYRDAFDKIDVIASAVPILFRRKMLELFTSPAVYLWNGTPSENLITGWPNEAYDTFTVDGTIILSAIDAGATGTCYSNNIGAVKAGDIITVIFDFNLNSGELPHLRITGAGGSTISALTEATEGFNHIDLTITADSISSSLRFSNTAATNFSTSEIIVKRKEIELDWVLLDRVEGSHDLREKMDSDNFECTLVLPENFTQQLSGQNI